MSAVGSRFRRPAEVVGDELLLVNVDTGDAFQLNRSGRAIFDLAADGLDCDEIGVRLAPTLAAPPETIARDARRLLEELLAQRLLERRLDA